MKPLIGITCGIKFNEKSVAFSQLPQEFHELGDAYVSAVEKAGGIPVILPCYADVSLMRDAADRLDGIIFSGGADIDPALFGERIITGVGPIDLRRDMAEAEAVRYVFAETKLPVLAICRGTQIINAIEGGTLIQDLGKAGYAEHRLSMYPRFVPTHDVTVDAGSKLAEILGAEKVRTNSFHHQAIKEAAPGWKITAHAADDNVIEAMELPGERFAVAVQWHPEALKNNDEEQALFRALVAEAVKYAAEK